MRSRIAAEPSADPRAGAARTWVLGLRVQGSGFGVQGLGFSVSLSPLPPCRILFSVVLVRPLVLHSCSDAGAADAAAGSILILSRCSCSRVLLLKIVVAVASVVTVVPVWRGA